MGLPGRTRNLTISSVVWIQCTNVTDGQTDGQMVDSKDRAYTHSVARVNKKSHCYVYTVIGASLFLVLVKTDFVRFCFIIFEFVIVSDISGTPAAKPLFTVSDSPEGDTVRSNTFVNRR